MPATGVCVTMCLDSILISYNYASALAEFSLWNYFTGPYAHQAPDGIGYSEAEYYDRIPLDSMDVQLTYPVRITMADNLFQPQPNAAAYIRLENLESIPDDTLLTMYLAVENEPVIRWGVSAIFQLQNDPDSHVVVSEVTDIWETWVCTEWLCTDSIDSVCLDSVCQDSVLYPIRYVNDILGEWVCVDGEFGTIFPCGPSTCNDSVRSIDLRDYRSITLVLTPSSLTAGPYSFGNYIGFAYVIDDTSYIDQGLVDLPPAILTPYPNPAVASEMDGDALTFRFQYPTDSTSFPISNTALLQLDVFNVAGEIVQTLKVAFDGTGREGPRLGGIFETEWDMKNQAGREVASGVYLVVARLYDSQAKAILLVQDRVKVAVIR